jgi:hypothetical protein
VSVAWVAGAIRGKALARRCLGETAAAELAAQPTLSAALRLLSDSTYGHGLKRDMTLEAAQRAMAETVLWHLRVLAGWLPPRGVSLVRALAGWFEMGDLEELAVAVETGGPRPAAAHLGALTMVWARAVDAGSLVELRNVLAHSEWGDPGGPTLGDVLLGIRLGWARMLSRAVGERGEWGAGALALAVAAALFLRGGGAAAPDGRRVPELRAGWVDARDMGAFVARVPAAAQWPFREVHEPDDLWRAERDWWVRLEGDAGALLRDRNLGRPVVLGAAAMLVADCRRAQGALAQAARAAPATASETSGALGSSEPAGPPGPGGERAGDGGAQEGDHGRA